MIPAEWNKLPFPEFEINWGEWVSGLGDSSEKENKNNKFWKLNFEIKKSPIPPSEILDKISIDSENGSEIEYNAELKILSRQLNSRFFCKGKSKFSFKVKKNYL